MRTLFLFVFCGRWVVSRGRALRRHRRLVRLVTLTMAILLAAAGTAGSAPPNAAGDDGERSVLRRENLVAWCIVPFDAHRRGPAARAAMLKKLGIRRSAYDWRAEHVPTFEQEIVAYQEAGIEFFAFWSVHDEAFRLFEQYDLHPQIWQTLSDPGGPAAEKVQAAAERLLPLARRTAELDCPLGLYNHGGWGGEPKNLVAVCRRLRALGQPHVGIVYNFHHGHGHIDDWKTAFAQMQPYLHCLNLDGMNRDADPKILGISKGAHELEMIREVVEAGYDGPIGILDHRPELDAEASLRENRDGLAWIARELEQPGSGGPQPPTPQPLAANANELGQTGAGPPAVAAAASPAFDPATVTRIVTAAEQSGDPLRGARLFADAKLACLSCHRVGDQGGTIGPELSQLGKQRTPAEIVESVLWPDRKIEPEFVVWQCLTTAGAIHRGVRHTDAEGRLVFRDPASGKQVRLDPAEIAQEQEAGTLMPSELTASLAPEQQSDLVRFLSALGVEKAAGHDDWASLLRHSQQHGPASFPLETAPLAPQHWPHATHQVNRQRLYDFYTKQADYFRQQPYLPMLLTPFPGIDGAETGHWGNQEEADWADDRWNATDLGSLQAGVFHGPSGPVPRAVCLRLGEAGELAVCFDPDTLTYTDAWRGGFVRFSDVRHGFLHGLRPAGERVGLPPQHPPQEPFTYHGFYRFGKRVVFAYRIGETEYLDAPSVEAGELVREVGPREDHSLRQVLQGGPAQWPQRLPTSITPGSQRPFAIDTIALPVDNPWKALLYCSGHAFLPDGTALVCTMQGDVWRVRGLDSGVDEAGKAEWRRFAAGLHHPLGLVVADGQVYVQCRDQLTRLTDLNGDGEADFYECFSNAFETSPAGHDFICGLQRDAAGRFYTASGNQGLVRISADGQHAEVLATGFRNPDGLGLLPDGTVTVPCSEGSWTPASMICAIPAEVASSPRSSELPLHYGYRGPRAGQPPELPLAYLPRGIDNSSGGQVAVTSPRWEPLKDQLLHFSFGAGAWFLVLRDQVAGQSQAAVVPLPGDFRSGVHRARFRARDGQLYVTGMTGWGSYTPEDGCFQRIRYTGDPLQLPREFHLHENGVRVRFTQPLDLASVQRLSNHFAQAWNYRYSGAYGSPEYSATHPGVAGHDPLAIRGAHLLEDGHSIFLEIPELQPVSQLHLRLHVNEPGRYLDSHPAGEGQELFITAHRLDRPFTGFPGYRPREKTIAAHPLLQDLALQAERVPNRWAKPIEGARAIELATGKNLTYATPQLEAEVNEPLAVTLTNPDVVPHNWVLVRPGQLRKVGELANGMIADPAAFARHYVPASEEILAHTDIVPAGGQQTIYFRAPSTPGRYPFLCTFPGHWMVMNGELLVR